MDPTQCLDVTGVGGLPLYPQDREHDAFTVRGKAVGHLRCFTGSADSAADIGEPKDMPYLVPENGQELIVAIPAEERRVNLDISLNHVGASGSIGVYGRHLYPHGRKV